MKSNFLGGYMSEMKLVTDDNEAVVDGVKYQAVESAHGCFSCDGRHLREKAPAHALKVCHELPLCMAHNRRDNRNVIFLRVQNDCQQNFDIGNGVSGG